MSVRKISLIGLTSAVLAIAPAHASNQNTAEEAQDADINSSTKIVCRRSPAPTGSRIGARRICRTQTEWNRLDDESRAVVERNQRNRFVPPPEPTFSPGGSGPGSVN